LTIFFIHKTLKRSAPKSGPDWHEQVPKNLTLPMYKSLSAVQKIKHCITKLPEEMNNQSKRIYLLNWFEEKTVAKDIVNVMIQNGLLLSYTCNKTLFYGIVAGYVLTIDKFDVLQYFLSNSAKFFFKKPQPNIRDLCLDFGKNPPNTPES
jgi:hypothetical protein